MSAFRDLSLKVLNGVYGAERYARAIAAGDVVDRVEYERRVAICKACESMVDWMGSDWCGEPFEGSDDPPTCGCLIAGKARVASESCPQYRWRAFRRGTTTRRFAQ